MTDEYDFTLDELTVDRVNILLCNNHKINTQYQNNYTLLHYAAMCANIDDVILDNKTENKVIEFDPIIYHYPNMDNIILQSNQKICQLQK